jgi:hypothetical protein
MAALGVWLWSKPDTFGMSPPCAIQSVSTVILGSDVPLRSEGLRVTSLVIYSLFLTPGLNLITPVAVFLGLYIGYRKCCYHHDGNTSGAHSHASPKTPSVQSDTSVTSQHTHMGGTLRQTESTHMKFISTIGYALRSPLSRCRAWYHGLSKSRQHVLPVVIGMATLLVINVIFIMDIELALLHNRNSVGNDETEWTFGQILAMLLLVLPLRDLVEMILARREKRHEEQRKREHTLSLQNAIRWEKMEAIEELLEKDADVNTIVDGMIICLHQ